MIILGIDPGTIVTGYGLIVVKGNEIKVLDYGCIRPSSREALTTRYKEIYQGLCEIIEKYKPDAVAVETQYMNKNVQSAIKLGMARGIVILAASLRNIGVYEYSPTKAKRAVVGNGRASKYQVQGMIQRLLSLSESPEPEDAADALALAICHANTCRFNNLKPVI